MENRQMLFDLWHSGVDAVGGHNAVATALRANPILKPHRIIAIGKAATQMAAAASEAFPDSPLLIITKDGHSAGAPATARVIEASHPVPNAASLKAGDAALEWVQACGANDRLLTLVSGGASALAEVLFDGMTLEDLAAATREKLGSGADIHAINAMRRDLSQVKGGKLLSHFKGARVTTLAISDVEGNDLNVIGSGIGNARPEAPFAFDPRIVASNLIARTAVVEKSEVPVLTNAESLYDDVAVLAPQIAARLKSSASGLHVFGGEPTVVLPPDPGLGGRNMMLALRIAREIAGIDGLTVLVGGTDGSDGPTDAAGAIVDGTTWEASGTRAIETAAPYAWLAARGALLKPGPTGTNVMDLLIAYRA